MGERTDMISLKGDTEPGEGEEPRLSTEEAGLGWLLPTLPWLVFLFFSAASFW